MKKSTKLFKLFLCLMAFFVFAPDAWGTDYYKIRVVAVPAEGESTEGKVYACAYSSFSNSHKWASDTTTGPWSEFYFGDPDTYLCTQETENAHFLGWYKDAACQGTRLSTSLKYNYNSTFLGGTSTSEATAPVTTFYALFTSISPTTFYARVHYVPVNHVAYSHSTGSSVTSYAYEITNKDYSTEVYNASSYTWSGEKTAAGVVERGWKFMGWQLEGNATYSGIWDNTSKYTKINITSNKTTAAEREIITMQLACEELPIETLVVQKNPNRGKVTISYVNYLENGTHTGLNRTTVNMDDVAVAAESNSYNIYSTDEITLTAVPENGYEFRGWFEVDEEGAKTKISEATTLSSRKFYQNTTLYAYFYRILTENDKFIVGQNVCQTLEEAISTAISSPDDKTIRVLRNCTIPQGTYTIPSDVTLLIPYEEEQEQPDSILVRRAIEDLPTGAYRVLTLAEGAHLNVYGTIEVGGRQSTGSAGAGGDIGVGRPAGPTYGQMILDPGSSVTLNDGSQLRAWGFVTGTGEIDVRRGAIVREQFQVMDWRGYDLISRMFNSHKVLPISQYYIQNVEAPAIYHPGSRLTANTAIRILFVGPVVMDDAGVIGVRYQDGQRESDKAIFLMDDEDDSEDTWVRKYYDASTDQQVYEVNNAAYLGSLVMPLKAMGMDVTMNSADYVLPITNNFKIHLKNGKLTVTQNTVLLPGAEIEVDKKATVLVDAGQTLSLYDSNQWDKYICGKYISEDNYQFTYGTRIKYRPGGVPGNDVRDISSAEGLGDAKLTVHGSVDVRGYLMTTEGGASISSTKEDAGTVLFTNAAPTFSTEHFVEQTYDTHPHYVKAQCVSGLLTNEAGSILGNFSQTAGTAAGKSYHFIDIDGDGSGEWVNLTEDGCFVYDQSGVYYIKPQAYVPISSGKPAEEADHTYRDHYAGSNKIYIEAACQWWEVTATATPGIFHCEHPDNNTYYYYDEDAGAWVEKKFNVVFKNYDGTTLTYKDKYNQTQDHYELPYNSHPQWLSDNPTRPEDANYSYTFNGWNPTITAETRVTDDMTFVAQYTEVPRQFIITFKNASGVEIETSIYSYLATPVAPTGEGINLETHQWSPAISAVTGNQVYQLVPKPEKFTVTYKNWDGTVLQTTSEITSGTTTPSCDEPSRAADALYSYTFKEWSPEPAATVTADAVYTATYNRASKNFTVRFFKEGTTNETKNAEGNLLSTQSVAYGAMPTPPAATKTSPADHTVYTLVWSPLVAAATGDQDYIATFTEAPEQLTVTWKNGTETLAVDHVNYGVTPAYSGLTPTKEDETKIYTFTGWSPAISAVTDDQEYVAQFDEGHLKSVTVGTSDSYSTAGHVETLILKASESASGQITANVTATNAYFDLTINATTELATGATRQWHAFGVPWQVNLDTDPIQEVGGSNRTFVLGRDYDIIYYNGAKRAASGAGYWCWEFLENHLHLLQPGQGYMIAFVPSVGNVGTIRFAKKNLAPVIFNGTMTVDANTGAVANNSGWNAIANPKACKVTLNAGPTTGYVYNPATDNYSAFNIENKDYIVGKVVYIQANASQSVVINNATGNPFVAAAPARRTEVTDKEYLSLDDYYQVAIASATTEGGHVYVLPEEEKENKYVIGHDLAQFGMSTAIPQVWVNRYDTKLALNTTALFNETAEFPMGVYAPNAGEYTISLNEQPSDEYNVYLTRDGQAIWNLSDGVFTTDLKAGIQSNYGLRLTANKAPQVVTGVDEAVVDAKGETRKVMINNQVYIIRGEQVYTIDGQLVK